jgi:hypothetical protein
MFSEGPEWAAFAGYSTEEFIRKFLTTGAGGNTVVRFCGKRVVIVVICLHKFLLE